MRILATAVAAGALIGPIGTGDAAPRRRGQVVRIARTEPPVTTQLRLCQLYDIDAGGCSREVKVGDTGWVVDPRGAYGEVRIVEVNVVIDACGTPTAWNISIDNSMLANRDYDYNAVLVLDHPVSERAQLLPTTAAPGGRPGELVSHVLDDDGDGKGDLLVTTFPCDEHGEAAPSATTTHQCTDYWAQRHDEWRHARTDLVPTCRR